jgi:hypothetical protein
LAATLHSSTKSQNKFSANIWTPTSSKQCLLIQFLNAVDFVSFSDEVGFLREKCSSVLTRFYDSKRHQKKAISSGGKKYYTISIFILRIVSLLDFNLFRIHDLRRDLQAVIGAKANLNLGPTIENYGGETFLSQEVAINLLQESKLAFKRCQNASASVVGNRSQSHDLLFSCLHALSCQTTLV